MPSVACLAFLAPMMVAALAAAGPVLACDGLAEGPSGTVTKVLDDDTFMLDSGIVVRLLGAFGPMPKGARAGSVAEPMADAAKASLEKLILNQSVRLGLDAEETDRYQHMKAQVFIDTPDGTWINQQMIARGMARVEVLPKGRACMAELIAAEAQARANGLGIWAIPYYSVRQAADPDALADRTGHYELIEGQVVGTGESKGRVYLDFGRVWKDDVTATIDKKALALFTAAGLDPMSLRGHNVRLRGWLESHDGPLLQLTLPEQLEVLDAK